MERTIGITLIVAAVTFAVINYGAGTVGFKEGLDIELLQANATTYAYIGATIAAGLTLILSQAPD